MIFIYIFMIFNLMKLRYIEKYVIKCFPVVFSSDLTTGFTIIIIFLQCRATLYFHNLVKHLTNKLS